MKRTSRASKSKPATIALALTWDGARYPLRSLPPAARSFLRQKSKANIPTRATKLAHHFVRDTITEIRICWVPKLCGGREVISAPFSSPDGRRLGYRMTKSQRFGDLLGVVYRRSQSKSRRLKIPSS